MKTVVGLTFEAGYIVVQMDSGPPEKHAISAVLRAADIPSITYSQVASIKALANLVAILIRTLIDRGILDESFLEDDDIDLDHIIAAIESMGGSYHEPGLEDADA